MGWIPVGGDGGGGEFINAARDHGATGDGTTDDTTALQNAIDAAEAAGSTGPEGETVTVYIPAGLYITEPLTVEESGVRVLMDPETTLRLKAGTYNPGDISEGVISIKGTEMNRISRVVIEGGILDGNKANITNTGNQFSMEGVAVQEADDCHLIGVRAINTYSDGFDWDFAKDCSAVRCSAENTGGWGFHASLGSQRVRMVDCDAVNCGHDRSRGGFDQWGGGGGVATDCTYLRCRAVDCRQNFNINSSGAHVGAIRSEGTTSVADNFSGVAVDMDEAGGNGGNGGGGTVDAIHGDAVIENPDTDIVVDHGIDGTPTIGQIQVTPYDQEAAASDFWLSDLGATTFQLNVASTPTVEATFGWLWVSAGAVPPPAPDDNLILWLDADAITGLSDTDLVPLWADESVHGNDFEQPISGRRPTYRTNILNGKPIVRFSGSVAQMKNPGLIFPSGNGHYTVVAVINWTNDGMIYSAGGFGSTNEAFVFRKNTSGRLNDGWWANNLFSPNSAVANSTWYIVATRYDGTGRELFVDDLSSSVASDSQTVKDTQTGVSILGASGTTPEGGSLQHHLGGDLAELRVYDTALTNTDMSDLQAALEAKWGL